MSSNNLCFTTRLSRRFPTYVMTDLASGKASNYPSDIIASPAKYPVMYCLHVLQAHAVGIILRGIIERVFPYANLIMEMNGNRCKGLTLP